MFKKGDKVSVTFDLAKKCPFLGKAIVTANGRVLNEFGGKTVNVYVEAQTETLSYYGSVEVPRKEVKRRDAGAG